MKIEVEGLFREGEEIIARYPGISYNYSKNTIKSRFRAGESNMAKDLIYSRLYAMDVIKGRFEEAEETIKNTGYWETYIEFLKSKGIEINC